MGGVFSDVFAFRHSGTQDKTAAESWRRRLNKAGLSGYLQRAPAPWLARWMPIRLFRLFIWYRGLVYFCLCGQARARIMAGFRLGAAGRMPAWRRALVLPRVFAGTLEHYVEKLINAHRPLSWTQRYLTRHVSIEGDRSWLDRLREQGRGGILVTGHFGGVEYLPIFMAACGYKLAMVVRFKTERLRRALLENAARIDVRLIDADRENVTRQIFAALENGRILVTLCDEFKHWRPDARTMVRLFGVPARCDKTLAVLCRRAKVPVAMGLVHRRGRRFCLEVVALEHDGRAVDPAPEAWRQLEQRVVQDPGQWYQWAGLAAGLQRLAVRMPDETSAHRHLPGADSLGVPGVASSAPT